MAQDIQLLIRQCFEAIYASARNDAKIQAALDIQLLKLDTLTCEQQILILHEELKSIKIKVDSLEKKEYYHLAGNKKYIYQLFSPV